MTSKLSSHNVTAFNALNRSCVEMTLSGIRRFANASRWLSKDNSYRVDADKKVEAEVAAKHIANPRHLAQYIAVSTLHHCTDGWSYLGRAAQALLRGDPHRARHLAYYAELRAAMSLLAAEGIGVFNRSHAIITAPNHASPVKGGGGTHTFVWDSLAYWAEKGTSGALFTKVVRPYGRDLDEWLVPIGGGAVVGAQAKQWFIQWGMDLLVLSRDRDARNRSSYQPEGISGSWRIGSAETASVVSDLWSTLEPATNSAFDTIDRHILRLTLESIHKSQTGRAASASSATYAKLVAKAVGYQGFSDVVAQEWTSFLRRQMQPNDAPIFILSRLSNDQDKKSSYAVVSRAALLLRMASGSTSQLFQSAGFDKASIDFWYKELGPARGLWNDGSEPENSIDMWSDIRQSLDDLAMFQADNPGPDHSFYNLASQQGGALGGLAGFERAMIWSMIPA
ncbi:MULTISPECIES: hypothetical protein [unclassified Mesorhizobium]|uniref:hypothetical protein n=1 Tax=unclassified Mesorhizobium TaxID=325217 RepID=UPI00112A39C8|nr:MULTISPECIES: hypothetical protein [unclassified Mesorhizobium]TPJ50510.1 hypothetical protein FJ426_25250 [Mesorhizobium sp. B2-6-4]TPM90193.1 hypothetical protein FJ966_26785 [Mesorhizobium sp. B2-1-5]